jgi:peptidoglycan/LPS O-acetylase OafA/YrhL
MTVRRLGRVPALDGLRGIAIALVVLFHTEAVAYTNQPTGVKVIDRAFGGGFLGVDLFFVLSGFLITALLLREDHDRGRVSFGSFYVRRALRLLPALFLLLAVHAIYMATTNPPGPYGTGSELTSVAGVLVYGTNWVITYSPTSVTIGLGHLWSLAIEEQFYLLWPAILIVFLGVRRRTDLVVAAIAALIVAVVLHRLVMWDQGHAWPTVYYRTDTRADGLLIGALLACLWVRGLTPRRGIVAGAWVAVGVVIVCLEYARTDVGWLYEGGFTLFAVAVAALILAAVDGRWVGNRFLELAPLRALGRVSYGMYLWQSFVFYAIARYGLSWAQGVRVLVAWSLIGACTAVSWFVVERPALRLKHRLDARRLGEPRLDQELVDAGPAGRPGAEDLSEDGERRPG